MGPETDIVEPVLAGFWMSGMSVREICPGMYGESKIRPLNTLAKCNPTLFFKLTETDNCKLISLFILLF